MPLDTNAAPVASAEQALRDERLAFLRFDAATVARLRKMQPVLRAALPAIADGF